MLSGLRNFSCRISPVVSCSKSLSIEGGVRWSSSSKKLCQAQPAVSSPSSSGGPTEGPPPPSENKVVEREEERQKGTGRTRLQAQKELEDTFTPFRYVYPEFLPDPDLKYRNRVREKLERMDMLNRRTQIDIPEFYVGSVLSVTVSDLNAPGKSSTFVGICTERHGTGLKSYFILRNVVEGLGLEVRYDIYNPTIQSITVLRLEKRLDDNLRYLRDAPVECSTVPFDMPPEVRSADAPVPINPMRVKLNPRPWSAKWQLWDLKGVEELPPLEAWQVSKLKDWKVNTGHDVKDYDLMKTYRETIPVEEQTEIYSEVVPQLTRISQSMKKQKRKRIFTKPTKAA